MGRVQYAGQEQDLVHRVLSQLRGYQECGGVQQSRDQEHGASRRVLSYLMLNVRSEGLLLLTASLMVYSMYLIHQRTTDSIHGGQLQLYQVKNKDK